MGLFKKKENEALKQAVLPPRPDLPEFPDLPGEGGSDEFPSYESTIEDIKNEVDKDDDLELPKRDTFSRHKIADLGSLEQPDLQINHRLDDEKPIFVKIEKYKEAVKQMEMLARKISEAEGILDNLEDLREKESQKIAEWKRDLAGIKDKLLSVDKELFGE